jgi:hypothetical protein
MRRIILSMFTTLDAKTARSDGDLEWFLTDERLEDSLLTLLHRVDAMIFGRVSYQLLAQNADLSATRRRTDRRVWVDVADAA